MTKIFSGLGPSTRFRLKIEVTAPIEGADAPHAVAEPAGTEVSGAYAETRLLIWYTVTDPGDSGHGSGLYAHLACSSDPVRWVITGGALGYEDYCSNPGQLTFVLEDETLDHSAETIVRVDVNLVSEAVHDPFGSFAEASGTVLVTDITLTLI